MNGVQCERCGRDSNCGFTTVKDAREDVSDIWLCEICFLHEFNGEYELFRDYDIDQFKIRHTENVLTNQSLLDSY